MSEAVQKAEWIAVDWGTSNLRVWIMDAADHPLAELTSDQGMGSLPRDGFEPALLALIAPHLEDTRVTPVICAGMVGAREGWCEAPYAAVPCAPASAVTAVAPDCSDPRLAVRILAGLKQMTPPDVMRGEETQIAGALSQYPNFDGVLCLPGTHTKWAHISAGEVVSFRTFMTGELFALVSERSVLRHSVTDDGFDQAAFASAVSDAMSQPQNVTGQLFGLRAGGLVGTLPAATARARLSGLLVGLELAGARPYWLGQNVGILGAGAVADLYRAGLTAQGVDAAVLDNTELTLAGLTAAYASHKEQTL